MVDICVKYIVYRIETHLESGAIGKYVSTILMRSFRHHFHPENLINMIDGTLCLLVIAASMSKCDNLHHFPRSIKTVSVFCKYMFDLQSYSLRKCF